MSSQEELRAVVARLRAECPWDRAQDLRTMRPYLLEEAHEVLDALDTFEESPHKLKEELGDLLFAAVNLVRLAGSHPTPALERANRKFRRRFERLEALARERGVVLAEAGLEQLDVLWDEVKAEER